LSSFTAESPTAGEREKSGAKEYELGHSERELKRLATQARLIDPITRQYFSDAGLAPGMRVLDIGSGGGDTALLTAELVGTAGGVVGVDRSPVAVSAARRRVKALQRDNIAFRHGDLEDLQFDTKFDAAVGRYVLMFIPNPVADAETNCSAAKAGRHSRLS
jgi:ubiquinone/menaquinone biosynthesis C-methylase UbiE